MSLRRLFLIVPLVALSTTLVAADDPDLDNIQLWLAQDSPGPKWRPCPSAKYAVGDPTLGRNAAEARNPYFGYSTPSPTFRCVQSGPYPWEGEQWWVQMLTDLEPSDTEYIDAIRVCSPTRVVPPNPATAINKPGPCVAGTGPRGCAVCVRNTRASDS